MFLKQDDLLVNTGSVTGAKIKISSSRIKDIISERFVLIRAGLKSSI